MDFASLDAMRALIAALDEPAILAREAKAVAFNAAARREAPGLREGAPLSFGLRAPDVLDALARLEREGGVATAQWRRRVPVERLFAARLSAVAGTPRLVLVTLRDLTDARRIERLRSDFVADVSHELRTPLAAILACVETLQGPARDDAAARARFLCVMSGEGKRMARLVDDLLSLSRIEQTEHMRPQGAADLAAIARETAARLAGAAADAGARIVVTAPDAAPIAGDRDELVRVVENLVANALKYGRPADGSPGSVAVAVADAGSTFRLAVSDNGRGVAPEHLPRLTERFYRAAPEAPGGSGLGLAIVKHAVQRHRGRLVLESPPAGGLRVIIDIPKDSALSGT